MDPNAHQSFGGLGRQSSSIENPTLWYKPPDSSQYGGQAASLYPQFGQPAEAPANNSPPPVVRCIPINWSDVLGANNGSQSASSMGSQFQIGGNSNGQDQQGSAAAPQMAPLYRDGSYVPAGAGPQQGPVYHGSGYDNQGQQPLKFRVSVGDNEVASNYGDNNANANAKMTGAGVDMTIPPQESSGQITAEDVNNIQQELGKIVMAGVASAAAAASQDITVPCGTCNGCKYQSASSGKTTNSAKKPPASVHLVRDVGKATGASGAAGTGNAAASSAGHRRSGLPTNSTKKNVPKNSTKKNSKP